jgi:hypothetical protein
VCLDLEEIAGKSLADILEVADIPSDLKCYPLRRWVSVLRNSPAAGTAELDRPLVLDRSGRLYLRRYWRYENTISESKPAG